MTGKKLERKMYFFHQNTFLFFTLMINGLLDWSLEKNRLPTHTQTEKKHQSNKNETVNLKKE